MPETTATQLPRQIGAPPARSRLILEPPSSEDPTRGWEIEDVLAFFNANVTLPKASVGLGNANDTADADKPISGPQATALALKMDATTYVAHLAAANPHSVTKAQVGLATVNDTADADKPVSGPQAAALALKADKNPTIDAATTTIDFASASQVRSLAVSSGITFSATGYANGRNQQVILVNGASSRTLVFPAGWRFIGPKPASIASSKIGVLSLLCRGSTEAEVLATYAEEI